MEKGSSRAQVVGVDLLQSSGVQVRNGQRLTVDSFDHSVRRVHQEVMQVDSSLRIGQIPLQPGDGHRCGQRRLGEMVQGCGSFCASCPGLRAAQRQRPAGSHGAWSRRRRCARSRTCICVDPGSVSRGSATSTGAPDAAAVSHRDITELEHAFRKRSRHRRAPSGSRA